MVTYICKYTPVELFEAMGFNTAMPNEETLDFSESDALIHPSVCSHAKQLLVSLLDNGEKCCDSCEKEELILTNCCDSIRRVYDIYELFDEQGKKYGYSTILDLPHADDDDSIGHYTRELMRLIKEHPDAILKEIAEQFGCSAEAVRKALKRNHITLKKDIILQRTGQRKSRGIS